MGGAQTAGRGAPVAPADVPPGLNWFLISRSFSGGKGYVHREADSRVPGCLGALDKIDGLVRVLVVELKPEGARGRLHYLFQAVPGVAVDDVYGPLTRGADR